MAIDYFYNNTIALKYRKIDGDIVGGLYVPNENVTTEIITCDVQPIEDSLEAEEYGLTVHSDYKVYCNPSVISLLDNDDVTITYGAKDYTIVKCVSWDSYIILYIKAV